MSNHIVYSTSTEFIRIPVEAIVYVSADGNYSCITMADGEVHMLTLQLGHVVQLIEKSVNKRDNRFLRMGKSLIINKEYVTVINPSRQKLILSDSRTFRYELQASKESLKFFKEHMEKEAKL